MHLYQLFVLPTKTEEVFEIYFAMTNIDTPLSETKNTRLSSLSEGLLKLKRRERILSVVE